MNFQSFDSSFKYPFNLFESVNSTLSSLFSMWVKFLIVFFQFSREMYVYCVIEILECPNNS